MEHASSTSLQAKRYAVVTGANKGIGFEICKQLASKGIVVVLTSRDEKRGLEAVEKLKESEGLSDFVIFHQLDVKDPASIASLADFIKTHFGKLDILVNNAGYLGAILYSDAFVRAFEASGDWPGLHCFDWNELATQNYEMAEECLKINYYGAKRMIEAHISLLQLSDSPRIVNVSSLSGLLKNVENEYAKTVLNDVENLTEEKIDEVLNKFMKDFKEGSLEKEGWRTYLSAYTVSKAALNAYTRLLAKKYPDFLVNSVCPGYVKTDINCNTGFFTSAEGAQPAVRLALLPQNGASVFQFSKSRHAVVTGANKGIGFEICKQLASKGVVVVLTSRDEKRGLEAVEKLRESEGLSDYVIFHQLDVTDPASIASLADFIKTQFGKLDILVNNAAVSGVILDSDAFVKAFEAAGGWSRGQHFNWNELATQTFEVVEECVKTNYYGAKRMVEALISFLHLSDSARIVNVSSVGGLLKHIPIERDKTMLSDIESLTEEKIDEFLNKFKKDFKEGSLEKQGWQPYLSTYTVSKAALNAYTRMLSKKYPNILINCVCPGSIKTDINCNTGLFTPEEGAQFAVRLALLPQSGSSGLFFSRNEMSCF